MRIETLMTTDVQTCAPAMSLHEVVGLMKEHDCGSLPVIDPRSEQLVGMVTDRDVCLKAHAEDEPLRELTVAETMTREPLACRPDEDLAAAEKLMREHQVRRIPVVDEEGRVQGVVTLAEVALAATRSQEADVRAQDVGRTLAAISAPAPADGLLGHRRR